MDVALAIHKYDPTAGYRLSDSNASTGVADIVEWRGTLPMPTQEQLEAAWLLCLNDLAAELKAEEQASLASGALAAMLNDLQGLNAGDAAYALMGRAMATKDGATQAVINSIINRATAAAYLTGKSEWIGLPASARAWLQDHLEMEAYLFQALIIVLRR
jgi:hypothetical protein